MQTVRSTQPTGCVVLLLKIKQQSASLRLLTLDRMTSGLLGVGNPKALENVNVVDENNNPVLDGDGNQVVTKGLKSVWVAAQKEIAATLLAPTDWYVTRKAEDSTAAIPAAVSTYRAAIRTTCGTRETEINACTTTDELAALLDQPC